MRAALSMAVHNAVCKHRKALPPNSVLPAQSRTRGGDRRWGNAAIPGSLVFPQGGSRHLRRNEQQLGSFGCSFRHGHFLRQKWMCRESETKFCLTELQHIFFYICIPVFFCFFITQAKCLFKGLDACAVVKIGIQRRLPN